uniref:Uncharacterized protein n=1 Tax=Nicotiana tabacum TaxID=4097 RepID=A0A1S3Y8C0_TOBAC|nr:PREDICTED: uncharacterized protein LOC107773670 [Nicotiana tabacum]
MNFRSMDEFWLFYMNQRIHSRPATRRWHFNLVLFKNWFVIFVPLFGYGFAWCSHFYVEGNVPAALRHPFWCLFSE